MIVRLTPPEFFQATQTGLLRLVFSFRSKQSLEHEKSWIDRLSIDVLGSCGEIAVSKALDKFHVGTVNTYHRITDCVKNIEVRTTTRLDGRLIIRDKDENDRNYVLVIANPPEMKIVGWINGGDAKKDCWLQNPNGYKESWFVPQSELKDFGLLL